MRPYIFKDMSNANKRWLVRGVITGSVSLDPLERRVAERVARQLLRFGLAKFDYNRSWRKHFARLLPLNRESASEGFLQDIAQKVCGRGHHDRSGRTLRILSGALDATERKQTTKENA